MRGRPSVPTEQVGGDRAGVPASEGRVDTATAPLQSLWVRVLSVIIMQTSREDELLLL